MSLESNKEGLKKSVAKFNTLSGAAILSLFAAIAILSIITVWSLINQQKLIDSVHKVVQQNTAQATSTARADCTAEVRVNFFADFGQSYSLTKETFPAFQEKIAKDLEDYKNAGKICDAKLGLDKHK